MGGHRIGDKNRPGQGRERAVVAPLLLLCPCCVCRGHAGRMMLAILPTHCLFPACQASICGENVHSGGRQEYREFQNREYGQYYLQYL